MYLKHLGSYGVLIELSILYLISVYIGINDDIHIEFNARWIRLRDNEKLQ